jgi:ubiquitin carboxyl-terminal hydrolase 16
MFKTEYIDDFKCEKCRLLHAISLLETEASKPSTASDAKSRLAADIARLQAVLSTDPEKLPEDIPLPDSSLAPKRRIARHTRLTSFPKILAIHLSRSIYDAQMSQKNAAKVSFPERLPLGGLLEQKKYKLLGVVTHKGSHYSGHYESFRRQNVYAPFSNPNTFQPAGVYSASTAGTPAGTPRIKALKPETSPSPLASTPDLLGPGAGSPTIAPTATITLSPSPDSETSKSNGPRVSLSSLRQLRSPSNAHKDKDPDTSSLRSVKSALSRIRSSSRSTSRPRSSPNGKTESESGSTSPNHNASTTTLETSDANGSATTLETPVAQTSVKPESTKGSIRSKKERRERKARDDRWWRISDDKIQQASTKDVLDMKQEVYLLFYELERAQGF